MSAVCSEIPRLTPVTARNNAIQVLTPFLLHAMNRGNERKGFFSMKPEAPYHAFLRPCRRVREVYSNNLLCLLLDA